MQIALSTSFASKAIRMTTRRNTPSTPGDPDPGEIAPERITVRLSTDARRAIGKEIIRRRRRSEGEQVHVSTMINGAIVRAFKGAA